MFRGDPNDAGCFRRFFDHLPPGAGMQCGAEWNPIQPQGGSPCISPSASPCSPGIACKTAPAWAPSGNSSPPSPMPGSWKDCGGIVVADAMIARCTSPGEFCCSADSAGDQEVRAALRWPHVGGAGQRPVEDLLGRRRRQPGGRAAISRDGWGGADRARGLCHVVGGGSVTRGHVGQAPFGTDPKSVGATIRLIGGKALVLIVAAIMLCADLTVPRL
jgi:hypothetical protein